MPALPARGRAIRRRRVRASRQQQAGQLRIVRLAGRAVQRRQPLGRRGLLQRGRRPAAADGLAGRRARRQQPARAILQPLAEARQAGQPRMGHGHQRRQLQRPTGPMDPARVALRGVPEYLHIAHGAGQVGVAAAQLGVVLQHPRRHGRPAAAVAAHDIAGIDQPQPLMQRLAGHIGPRAADLHEKLQIGPGWESVFAGDARLRVVQAKVCRRQSRKALPTRGGQGCAQPLECGRLAETDLREQFLGLFLEVADIRPGGNALHGHLRTSDAEDPQCRLHKRRGWMADAEQVGSTLPAGPGASCTRPG